MGTAFSFILLCRWCLKNSEALYLFYPMKLVKRISLKSPYIFVLNLGITVYFSICYLFILSWRKCAQQIVLRKAIMDCVINNSFQEVWVEFIDFCDLYAKRCDVSFMIKIGCVNWLNAKNGPYISGHHIIFMNISFIVWLHLHFIFEFSLVQLDTKTPEVWIFLYIHVLAILK